MVDRDEIVAIIYREWPRVLQRGLITHLHRNYVELANGERIHLRVLVQQLRPQDAPDEVPPTGA